MRIPPAIRQAIVELVGAEYIGSARAALDFPSLATILQARLTITVTGAALGDEVTVAPEADLEAGLSLCAYVSAANTVTVSVANNTAGTIDPASCTYKVRVSRRTV